MNYLLSLFTTPSGFAYACCMAGLLCLCVPRLRRGAVWLLAVSSVVLTLFSLGPTAAVLMSPLEYQYPSLGDAREHAESSDIVVLTGWAGDDPNMPLSARLNDASAYRVLLALELYRERPDCSVIVSGHGDSARLMAETLRKLGVEADRLRVDRDSRTTADSARQLHEWLGTRPFFLVTSAGHMPRAMAAMQRAQLAPIAAPTDYRMPREIGRAQFTPTPYGLAVADLATHEYLGRIWYALKGTG